MNSAGATRRGGTWALVNLVGRKTRWGACTPQRITLQEMRETTHSSRQGQVDVLAALAYSTRSRSPGASGSATRSLPARPARACMAGEDGRQVIDLLHVPAYPLPERGLKSRTTRGIALSVSNLDERWSQIEDHAPAAQSAPGQALEAALDDVEKRDTIGPLAQEETPPSGAHHPAHGRPASFAAVETGQPCPVAAARPAPKHERKRGPLWDTVVGLFHQPMGGELKDWRSNIIPEVHRQGITPEHQHQAARRYRREHPTWNSSFKAVFNHQGELLKSSQSAPVPTLAAYQ